WSVALISPPSANRAVPVRVFLVLLWLAGAAVQAAWAVVIGQDVPFCVWIVWMCALCSLSLVIAVNERERWAPRRARPAPRRWWLRWPAFLFYSGSAGGVLFSALLFGLTALATQLWREAVSPNLRPTGFRVPGDIVQTVFGTMSMLVLYTYCYALSAV